VHPADIQDRDGGVLVLATLFGLYPFLQSFSPMAATKGLYLKRERQRPCRV